MFVKRKNYHLNIELWADSRLVNVSTDFCLCGCCTKNKNEKDPTACQIHERHKHFNRTNNLVAPILGCPEFAEDKTLPVLLDKYYLSGKA